MQKQSNEHTGAGLPLSLVARTDITFEGACIRAGEQFEAEAKDAVCLILRGDAELSKRQSQPPHDVITAISERLENLDRLGPKCLREKTIQKFEEQVLAGDVLKSAVAGRALHWLHGKRALSQAIRDNLGIDQQHFTDVLQQLRSCMKQHCEMAPSFETSERYSKDQLLEMGLTLAGEQPSQPNWLEHGRDFDQIRPRFRYLEIGPQWVAFERSLDALENAPSRIQDIALSKGRILAVCERCGSYSVLAPWAWKQTGEKPKCNGDWHFLLSRDLPRDWVSKVHQFRGEERKVQLEKAMREIEKRYLDAAPHHNTQQKQDVVEQVAQDMGVSVSLVNEAWKLAEIPNWKKPGRREGK